MARAIKNTSRPNREISIWLLRWVNENFKSEGGNVGKWKPFKKGGRIMPDGSINTSAKLLQDTGRLRASFSNYYSRKVAGVGSDLDYSLTHELGLPHKRLPARHMIPLEGDTSIDDAVLKIYGRHIDKALR